VAAQLLDQRGLRIAEDAFAGTAAAAGTEAGALGGLGPGKEADLLAARTARGAGGAAVHAGGAYSVHEQVLEAAVALQHGVPEFLRSDLSGHLFHCFKHDARLLDPDSWRYPKLAAKLEAPKHKEAAASKILN